MGRLSHSSTESTNLSINQTSKQAATQSHRRGDIDYHLTTEYVRQLWPERLKQHDYGYAKPVTRPLALRRQPDMDPHIIAILARCDAMRDRLTDATWIEV
eukprot:GHVU01006963.1.p1 GENE.GHVU01006963.1~~GHVU01006963.1.p1  ORF type:complete len:100 (-),score=6.41 GHVU01006963.1:162-461(-)